VSGLARGRTIRRVSDVAASRSSDACRTSVPNIVLFFGERLSHVKSDTAFRMRDQSPAMPPIETMAKGVASQPSACRHHEGVYNETRRRPVLRWVCGVAIRKSRALPGAATTNVDGCAPDAFSGASSDALGPFEVHHV
jgi:hypothetical protein